MKKYINSSIIMVLMTMLTLSFTACSSDDDSPKQPAPQITLDEANIEGDILCVQADVVAKGRTAAIQLTVTGNDGAVKLQHAVTDSKYIGVLNIEGFHVHVNIVGKNVQEGDVLKMSVTDGEGQLTTAQKSITAEEEDEDEHHDHDE